MHSKAENSANVGLMDQAMALKWIQKNIEHFGGDKDRVTVMGESAGSASVNFLMLSPMAKGTFQKGETYMRGEISKVSDLTQAQNLVLMPYLGSPSKL